MRRELLAMVLFMCPIICFAQKDIFVLVDVSRSVSQQELSYAKQELSEVLSTGNRKQANISHGSERDLSSFKLAPGDRLSIVRFGSLQTTLAINPVPVVIQNQQADVAQAINAITWTPSDNQTYYTLAKAKIAEYAKNHNIARYKLYIVSDNVQDDYGPGGKPGYPDDYTRNLAEGYNSSANPVSEGGYTRLKFDPKSYFTLSFSPSVDVSSYNLPQPLGGVPSPAIDSPDAAVKLTSYSNGKKGKEIQLGSETLNLSWVCHGCPEGVIYKLIVSGIDQKKFKAVKTGLISRTLSMNVPDGKYKIQVMADNYAASSDNTYVEVATGGFGSILLTLVLVILLGVGYYFWNKRREEKLVAAKEPSMRAEDIFGKGSNQSSNSSSNSEYF